MTALLAARSPSSARSKAVPSSRMPPAAQSVTADSVIDTIIREPPVLRILPPAGIHRKHQRRKQQQQRMYVKNYTCIITFSCALLTFSDQLTWQLFSCVI